MLIEKSRSGVYQDTPENRRLHRVGQRYGEAKKPEEKKGGDNAKGVEIATSKAGIKAFLSGKIGGDYYRAVAEAYNALKKSGKSKSVDLMLKESGSGSPSKDIPAKVYVKAVNSGATHDEAVKFADDCFKEFLAKIENVQQKVHNEGVNASAATKMFDAASKWLNAQEFEKKAASGSGVKKGETKLPSKLGDLEFNEDKPTGERWYEGKMGGQRVRILQEKVGKDDWWVAEISGRNVVDDNNKAMKFDNVQDALEEVKQEIKSSELPKVNLSEKDFRREVNEEAMKKIPNAKVELHHYLAPPTDYYDNDGNLMRSTPAITEFYSDRSYSSIGGYQIYFGRADSIGLFKTKESAIAALNKYVNAMKVKGHSKSKWTYDKLNSRYRWNYTIPTPPEKQVEEVPSKVEPVKENNEKQDKPTSRVTFADVPRSRKVNLKKYLTDSRRKDVDRLMQTADGMPLSAIKQAHDAAVKKFNDNFDSMKKSERASALYVIMKYKDLLNKAKSLTDKNAVSKEGLKQNGKSSVEYGKMKLAAADKALVGKEITINGKAAVISDIDKWSDDKLFARVVADDDFINKEISVNLSDIDGGKMKIRGVKLGYFGKPGDEVTVELSDEEPKRETVTKESLKEFLDYLTKNTSKKGTDEFTNRVRKFLSIVPRKYRGSSPNVYNNAVTAAKRLLAEFD